MVLPPKAHGAAGVSADDTLALLYNVGLQHLLLGRHAAALACFRGAAPGLQHQPLLWLRMAECAIGLAAADGQPAAAISDAGQGDEPAERRQQGMQSTSTQQLAQAAEWLRTALALADSAPEVPAPPQVRPHRRLGLYCSIAANRRCSASMDVYSICGA